MRYWWVNQNQTFKEEVGGGYLWSPKRNQNGARNQFYENMRSVTPGDTVFSFRDTHVSAVGVARSYCYDAPKPVEFGTKGKNWEVCGWKVEVTYSEVVNPIRPKDHIELLRPHLPRKYSPLQQNGDGLQSVYLAEIDAGFAEALERLLLENGNELAVVKDANDDSQRDRTMSEMEAHIQSALEHSQEIGATEKEQLVKARRGQGQFRENVRSVESGCRVTGVSDRHLLIASHIKPWRCSTNEERLDGDNGLLLTPNVDFLFDRGFISFSDDGDLLRSPMLDDELFLAMGVPSNTDLNCGAFSERQKRYLRHHRRDVFLEAGRVS